MSMDDIPPEVLEELMAEYAAEQGDASMLTGEQSNYYGMMPQMDLEGDPYDLSKQLNQFQDVNQIMNDPMFQAMSGLGAFSANAFQPRVRMEAVESPEYVRWQNYLNSPTSFEGMVAAELEGGGTPYSAIRKIRAKALENPEGSLAQELQALFPVMDQAGAVPGEINWQEISGAATEIDEMRGKIPQIGNAGFTMEDGTVVSGGGEIMEVMGPDGRPQLVRRIEEPTELMEKFDELGYPYPTEQYTPESFMGPEWAQARDEFESTAGAPDQLLDKYSQSYQDYLNEPQVTPRGSTPRPEAEGEEVHTVGTTDVALTGDKTGVPEYAAERGIWGTGTVPGISTEAPVSLQEFNQIQDPAEWLDFYNAHANELTDGQRMEVIGNIMARGGPSQLGGQWDMVLNQVNDDMGYETEEGGGFGEIDLSLPDIGGEDNPLVAEAQNLRDPNEYKAFINSHLDQLSDADIADLGSWATNMGMTIATGDDMDSWSNLAGDLLGGDIKSTMPAPAQGFAGTPRLGGEVPAGSTSKIAPRDYEGRVPGRTFYPQGDEPVPPPGDLSMAGNEADQWFGSTSDQRGVAPGGPNPAMTEAMLRQQTPPYVYGGGYTPPRDVQREAAIARGDIPPPVTIGGQPNPEYQEYLDSIVAPQMARQADARNAQVLPGNQQRTTNLPPIPSNMREAVASGEALGPPSPMQPGMNQTYGDYLAAQPQQAGTYRNTWGPTENPFTAFGLNQEYIPPEEPGGPPPVTVNGAPNPAYQDYLDTVVGPQIRQQRQQRGDQRTGGFYPGQGSESNIPSATINGKPNPAYQVYLDTVVTPQIRRQRTGETAEEERYDPLSSANTGEHVRRTDEDRRRLAEQNAPDLESEEFNILGGDRTRRGMKRQIAEGDFREWMTAKRARGRQNKEIYSNDWARAMRAVYDAQLAGATPTQQVFAQRAQNIRNAGIPLQNAPRVLQY